MEGRSESQVVGVNGFVAKDGVKGKCNEKERASMMVAGSW